MSEPAKIPHWKDMDEGWNGQFLQHWRKRHHHPGVFDTTPENFPDDSKPLWYAIRSLHDRIHAGKAREGESMEDFPIPTDHVHLLPLAEQIKKDLEELI